MTTAEELIEFMKAEDLEYGTVQHRRCLRRIYWKDAKRYVRCEMCEAILESAEKADVDVLIEINWDTNIGRNCLPRITNSGEIKAMFQSHDESKCDFEPAAPLFRARPWEN